MAVAAKKTLMNSSRPSTSGVMLLWVVVMAVYVEKAECWSIRHPLTFPCYDHCMAHCSGTYKQCFIGCNVSCYGHIALIQKGYGDSDAPSPMMPDTDAPSPMMPDAHAPLMPDADAPLMPETIDFILAQGPSTYAKDITLISHKEPLPAGLSLAKLVPLHDFLLRKFGPHENHKH